jgi:hypothetical protein
MEDDHTDEEEDKRLETWEAIQPLIELIQRQREEVNNPPGGQQE